MRKIQKISILDYGLLSIGFFLFFTLMRPYGLENSISDTLWPLQSLGSCTLIFISSLLSDIIVCFIFRLPCDYSKEWSYQIKRGVLLFLFLALLVSAFIGQYFTILQWGWEHWNYFWHDQDGQFSLQWYLSNFYQNLIWALFVSLYGLFMTKSRMKEHKIQMLLSLNNAIDQAEIIEAEQGETVVICGEYKESLVVLPNDILYIESIANYLSIWYFQDDELKHKRIRSTLKNVEETLSVYPFLLHCHRAFLVNTRFITHVDGNAAGCQLHLFSIDRTIPVSKANIEALRKALSADK